MDARSKDLEIDIKTNNLRVVLDDKEIINGEFYEKVSVEECIWTIDTENGKKFLDITIQKWPK